MNSIKFHTTAEWGKGKHDDWLDILRYITDDVETTKVPPCTCLPIRNKPTIKQVIFNNPATIIIWSDKTKTVVKCQKGDVYDAEKGFVMAYLKKLLGNDNTFNKQINKWVYGE